jgi:hypothetical protein
MAAKKKTVRMKKLGMQSVTLFKIANRRGYGAIACNNLTEGRSAAQAYARLVKACRYAGWELPEKGDLPALKKL